MKSYLLKYKAALCLLALLAVAQSRAITGEQKTFIEETSKKVLVRYDEIEALSKELTADETPANFRFGVHVDKWLAIQKTFKGDLDELAKKAADTASAEPNSNFHVILQKTIHLAQELFNRLSKICKILNDHRNLPNNGWKDTVKLIKPLKPALLELIADKTLSDLINRLTEIEALLKKEDAQSVAKDLAAMKAVIQKLKNEAGKAETDLLQKFNNISNKLKKL
jgi:hypothetical protein